MSKTIVKSGNQCQSLIQTITNGHNGSLEVDMTEGVGTEFIVQLPVVWITDYEDYTDGTDHEKNEG